MTMTMTAPTPRSNTAATAIRPFRVEAPQADLDDLRQRITATRWPEQGDRR